MLFITLVRRSVSPQRTLLRRAPYVSVSISISQHACSPAVLLTPQKRPLEMTPPDTHETLTAFVGSCKTNLSQALTLSLSPSNASQDCSQSSNPPRSPPFFMTQDANNDFGSPHRTAPALRLLCLSYKSLSCFSVLSRWSAFVLSFLVSLQGFCWSRTTTTRSTRRWRCRCTSRTTRTRPPSWSTSRLTPGNKYPGGCSTVLRRRRLPLPVHIEFG